MNDLEKQILYKIGEDPDNPDVFGDITQIRDSVNDAIQEISMLTGSHKEVFRIPLLADQIFYRLDFASGYLGWVTNAFVVNNRRRLPQTDVLTLTANDPRWMVHSSYPTDYFQISDNVIGIHPKPSGDDDMIELNCVVIPARYKDDNDKIFLKQSFERATIHYAVSEYWASRGDAVSATLAYTKYLAVLNLRELLPDAAENIYTYKTNMQDALI